MEQKQFAPSMTFTEREVRKTKIGTLGVTKTGMLLTSANGPGDKIINITSEDELVQIFGKPTAYNYKDWFNAASYLKYASDLYVVRPIVTEGVDAWENAGITFTVDYDSNYAVTSANASVANMYNEDIADNTLFSAGLTNKNALQFIDKYVNKNNEVGVLVCSKKEDYDLPLLESNMVGEATIGKRAYLNLLTAPVVADLPAALALLENSAGAFYHPMSSSAHGDAYVFLMNTTHYTIVRLNKTNGTFNPATQTTWTLANSNGFVETFDLTTLANGSYKILNKADDSFYTYSVSTGTVTWNTTTPDTYQSPLYIPHYNTYSLIDYIIMQDFASSLYDGVTKKLKPFSDIVQKNLNFIQGDLAVLILLKNIEGLWEVAEIFYGNYDEYARETSGVTKSIKKKINKDSKYVYCVTNATYSDFINTWSTKSLNLIQGATTGTAIITQTTVYDFEKPSVIGYEGLVAAAEDNFGANGQLQPELLIGFHNQANSGWLDTMPIIANLTGMSLALVGLTDETGMVGAKEKDIVEDIVDLLGNARTDTSFGALTEFNTYTMSFNEMKLYWDKYNQKYVWVPIVGDIAGKMCVNDFVNGADSAIAGTDRGVISNYARLLYSGNYNQNLLSKNGVNGIIYDYDLGTTYLFEYMTNTQLDLITKEANVRRMIIKIKHFLKRILKGNYFEYNNTEVRDKTLYQIGQVFEAFKESGGLYDYELICNDENNTADMVNQQKFVLDIKLQPGRLIKHIIVNIINYDQGLDIRESE